MRIRRFLNTLLAATRRDDRGFSLVEYSLVTAGVVLVVIAGVAVMATWVLGLFDPFPF
jgi:Flp pilus assembly pilin Flp